MCVTTKAPLSEWVERGSNALAGGGWVEARACFERALGSSDSAEAWDGLSWACWWLEDGTAAIQAREHAYRRYKDAGDRRAAARMAIWLANDHLDFRGEAAVAQGWLRRATRILDDLDPAPEHGWLAALEAQFALEAGELAEAVRIGTRVRQLGRDLGITDLEMLGLATEGLALVTGGELKEGMWRLDEAAAAALGGEYEDFVGVGWTCCYLIYACERVRDYDRAAQWCRNVEEFAERMRIQFLNGVCRVHYAAVLTWHGSWKEADEVLSKAIVDLAATRPPFAHEGMVRLADLRRRQGRIEEAERLFAQAESHPMAAVGMAELSLDRDDPDGAIPVAERRAATASARQQDSAGRRARARRAGQVRRRRRARGARSSRGAAVGRAGRTHQPVAGRGVLLRRRRGRGRRRPRVRRGRVRGRRRAVRGERRAVRAGARPHGVGPRARRAGPPGSGTAGGRRRPHGSRAHGSERAPRSAPRRYSTASWTRAGRPVPSRAASGRSWG